MDLQALKRIVVVGAGQMGRGIAQVCAQQGYQVSLCDADLEIAQAGKARIAEQLQVLLGKGRIEPAAATDLLSRLTPSALDSAAPNAQLVIEAVSEDITLKRHLFERLDQLAPKDAILASNTSSISLTTLGGFTKRAPQVVGMHFMNPVPLMKLVEVIRGLESSTETVDLVCALGEQLGKTVVLSQDRPGFIVNRILIPMLNEACFTLQDGVASVSDIDAAIQLGLNHPMGPLRLSDLIGLDTVLAIAEVLHQDFADSKYRPSPLLRNLVAAGHLGNKSGRGFYLYEAGKPQGPNPALQNLAR